MNGQGGRRGPNTAALARLLSIADEKETGVTKTIGHLKSMYVDTGREEKILESIRINLRLLAMRHETGNDEIEVRGTAVTAATGFGKSRICRQVLRSLPIFAEDQFDDGTRPLVTIKCRSPCSLDSIGRQLLRATDYGADGRGAAKGATATTVWDTLRDRFEMLGTIALYIDEINSLTKGANIIESEKINDNLKSLLNNTTWPIVVLLSGTEKALPYLHQDDELVRRIDWLDLAPMRSPEDSGLLAGIIEDLCGEASIAPPPDMERSLVPRLIHSTANAVGWPIDIVIRAIEIALDEGRACLAQEDFAKLFGRSSGFAADRNPFVAIDWHATPVFPRRRADDGDEKSSSKKRGRKRSAI